MSKQIDLHKYTEFVKTVTSNSSNDLVAFMNRLDRLDANYEHGEHGPDINVPLLLTSAIGLGGECGEFQEIIKKLFFHDKELTESVLEHLKKELGDVMWYWASACRALQLDPNDVIAANVEKLRARYPGEEFDPYYAENRQQGDI